MSFISTRSGLSPKISFSKKIGIAPGETGKNAEDIIKLETPISGVTDVVRQALEFVAAIFRIPFVKFLGISPGGLNATGESDLRNYYDHILSKQEKIFRKPIDRVLEIVQAHLYGEVDPDIKASFIALSDEDDSKTSVTRKTQADRDAIYLDRGVLSPEEVRESLASDPDSGYAFIDPLAVPEMNEPDPMEGMPGGVELEAPEDIDTAGVVAADAKPQWITVNGAAVRIDEDGQPQGTVGAKLSAGGKPEENTGRSRNKAPVSELSGNELGKKDGESLQDAAKRYYETLRANPVEREGFGKVEFTRVGRNKLESASLPEPERLKLLPAVKPIIQSGDYIGRAELTKERKDGIVAFHYFEGNVKIDGETKFLGVSVGEDKFKRKFYNLTESPDVLLTQKKQKAQGSSEEKVLSPAPSEGSANDENAAIEALNLIVL